MELKGTQLCLLGCSVSNYIYVYLQVQTKEQCSIMPCLEHSLFETISQGPSKQIKEYSAPCVIHVCILWTFTNTEIIKHYSEIHDTDNTFTLKEI
jgi:hypothetical protein